MAQTQQQLEVVGPVAGTAHYVSGRTLVGPYPEGTELGVFALGCFWGAERAFWSLPGVWVTAVGYSGGRVPSPSYERVCTGTTGHAESVLVAFDPAVISYNELLRVFWEAHDPTQGNRQGNDVGTQYRSAIFTTNSAQAEAALAAKAAYEPMLRAAGYGPMTTEIAPASTFYLAEDYHQQYLAKNPRGYCGLGGTGVSCPVGVGLAAPGRDN
jgi:peptide-methionine (S)-S-oxide reductase